MGDEVVRREGFRKNRAHAMKERIARYQDRNQRPAQRPDLRDCGPNRRRPRAGIALDQMAYEIKVPFSTINHGRRRQSLPGSGAQPLDTIFPNPDNCQPPLFNGGGDWLPMTSGQCHD